MRALAIAAVFVAVLIIGVTYSLGVLLFVGGCVAALGIVVGSIRLVS